ncbi:MAG: MlaA family lipoprotein [Rhizomicrobium sp.]
MRIFLRLAAIAAGLCLSACSTPSPSALANNDPQEATNREIFDFNQKLDRWTLRPAAERYNNYVPGQVREAVHNTLTNLNLSVTFANDVLQGEPKRATQILSRFTVNSTLGVGGLFDVASRLGIPEHSEDFGQTLAVWGVGEGPYMVLPLLGPAPPRDTAGLVVDVFFDPTIYIPIKQHILWMVGRQYFTLLDVRARNMETLDDIERNSLDFYAASRSLYRQYRANEIRNGEPDAPPPKD